MCLCVCVFTYLYIYVCLCVINVFQVEAGWLGFYGTIGGCAAGIVTARYELILF